MGVTPVLCALLIGGMLGIIAGFVGGRVNMAIMRIMDVFYAFPSVLLAISLSGAMGAGTENTLLSLTLVFIPPICRVSESVTTQVRGFDFVEAARASGASALTIVRVHVLGNVLGPILVYATSLISVAIILAAGLSFLGLGVKPPEPEWGLMLNTLRQAIYVKPLSRPARRDDLHHLDVLQPDERRPARGHGREGLTWTRCIPSPIAAARPSRCCWRSGLRKHFPMRRRPARPRPQGGARRRRPHPVGRQGRDAGHRRRVRLRQVDGGAAADAPDRARHAAPWCSTAIRSTSRTASR